MTDQVVLQIQELIRSQIVRRVLHLQDLITIRVAEVTLHTSQRLGLLQENHQVLQRNQVEDSKNLIEKYTEWVGDNFTHPFFISVSYH